jgi:spore coat protein U-like protein
MNRVLSAAAAVLLASTSGLWAGTTTDTFDVTIEVQAGCTIAATDINFGQVAGNTATPANSNSTLTVNCTASTPYDISFAGLADTAAGTLKTLAGLTGGNTDTLSYSIVNAATPTTVYGSTSGALGNGLSSTGTGSAQTHTVAAKLNNWTAKAVTPDTYKDTVTATVTY